MTHQEVPVQGRKRAGAVATALRGVVTAALAVRAHALDVLAGGDIGLASHHAAIGVLAHAQGVGQLHPFHGINIDRQVPGVHLPGLHTEHQRVQAGDHQALDVIGVAMLEGLRQSVAQAGHISGAGPEPGWQVLLRIEGISVQISRHLGPVDAAGVFAPAENLPNETFHAGQWRMPVAVSRFGASHHFARVQQLQVERGRQMRVVQPGVARPDCILVAPEQRQSLANEGVQGLQRLRPRDRPGKTVEPTGMAGKACLDERDDLARHGVGLENRPRRDGARPGSAKGLAIVSVEVPLATNRLIALHQHLMPLALLAIEILHAQRLATFGMGCEVGNAGEKVAVLADIQRQALGLGQGFDCLQYAPVARLGHHQTGRLQAQDVGLQLRSQAAGVARRIESGVVQAAACRLQRQREVAHGCDKHRGTRFA